ncbi:MAG: FAD-dependent oxidoreductase, partial [Sediminibacterium sp.]
MRNIIIIGNGIAGITCARHIRKLCNDPITVISAESDHFFSRTALMYIYMGHMKYEHTKPYEDFFWEKNRIQLLRKYVVGINSAEKNIVTDDGSIISYDVLVIATGSITQKFDWPGQDLAGVTGLYSLQDLEAIEKNTQNIQSAVITGGGLIGMEMAEMLHTRKIEVTMLVKDKYYWGSVLPPQDAVLVANQMRLNGIEVIYETELKEIKGDDKGKVTGIITSKDETIPCQFVGIATGVKPNISFLKDSSIKTDKGVLVNDYFETNCENVYS